MVHRIVGSVLIVALSTPCTCTSTPPSFRLMSMPEDTVIQTPQERCVYVSSGNGHGTGVVLKSGVVVTNFHGVSTDNEMLVSEKAVKILKAVPQNDLAFLSFKGKATTVTFGEARVGDEVYYIGNPADHKCVKVRLTVIEIRGRHFFVDGLVLPGSSGSGVWNSKGELVGIVKGRELIGPYNGFGLIIGSKTIREEMP